MLITNLRQFLEGKCNEYVNWILSILRMICGFKRKFKMVIVTYGSCYRNEGSCYVSKNQRINIVLFVPIGLV